MLNQNTMVLTLRSGALWDLINPDPQAVHWPDIAHHLALTNRFNGATRVPYSVAEHSLYVAALVEPRHRLAALIHDAHEAIIGDLVQPVKAALTHLSPGGWRDGWDALDHRTAAAIHAAADVTFPLGCAAARAIHVADMRALAAERRDFLIASVPWELPDPPATRCRAERPWRQAADDWLTAVTTLIWAGRR